MAYIYAIESENGRVKVGHSKDPESRLEQLKTSSPVELSLVKAVEVDDPKAAEKEAHQRLDGDSVRREWFDTGKDVPQILDDVSQLDEDELPSVRQNRKNLKIPESLFLALRDDKGDNQSWPHYLETECLHDEAEGLGDIRSALSTLETRMGKIEQQLEEMERQLT